MERVKGTPLCAGWAVGPMHVLPPPADRDSGLPAGTAAEELERLARQDMHVQMEHRLPRVVTLIDDESISAFQAEFFGKFGYLAEGTRESGGVLVRHVRYELVMTLGYHQVVASGLGVDVAYDKHVVVLIQFFRRDLPFHNLAEYAIIHFQSLLLQTAFPP